MPGEIATIPRLRFMDNITGAPLAIGSVTVYAAGTTTLENTWQDRDLTILNTNPIILDGAGSCVVWLDSAKSYKIVVRNSLGAIQWTQDNIEGGGVDTSVELSAALIQAALDEAEGSADDAAASALLAQQAAAEAQLTNPPIQVDDYDGVRAYAGAALSMYVTGSLPGAAPARIAGMFTLDDADTTTPDNNGTVLVGVGGKRWKRPFGDRVSILWFIPPEEHAGIVARTSEYDCHDAIINAIESVYTGSSWYWSGPEIYFPPGRYRVLSTINIKRQVILRGSGSGFPHYASSQLSFPGGVQGIIINSWHTDGMISYPGPRSVPPLDPPMVDDTGMNPPNESLSSLGTVIEGFYITGDVRTDTAPYTSYPYGHYVLVNNGFPEPGDPEAHGIRVRGMCLIRNTMIFGFEGNGITCIGDARLYDKTWESPGTTTTDGRAGNSNLMRFEGVAIYRCAGHGIYIDSSNSSAGYGYCVNTSTNGGIGIYDSSFLGNTWVACHANTNYGGQYVTDNNNACSVFVGCYSESGGGTSSFSESTLVLGGLHGAGIEPGARFVQPGGAGNGLNLYPDTQTGAISLGFQFGASATVRAGPNLNSSVGAGHILRWQDTTETTGSISYWSLNRMLGRAALQRGNVGGVLSFLDPNATVANGYARNYADGPSTSIGQMLIGTHFFGGVTEMRYRGLSAAAPVTGEFIKGDIIWNSLPNAAGKMGWVCTTSGTAGSTAVFKQFGTIDA